MELQKNVDERARLFSVYKDAELVVTKNPKKDLYPFKRNEGALFLCGVLANDVIVNRIAEQVRDVFHQTSLYLTPIEQITEEHSIELFDLEKRYNNLEILNFKTGINYKNIGYIDVTFRWVNPAHNNDDGYSYSSIGADINNLTQYQIDYLRSKGYALPWMKLSVEDLVEKGWVVLRKEESNVPVRFK